MNICLAGSLSAYSAQDYIQVANPGYRDKCSDRHTYHLELGIILSVAKFSNIQ